LWKSGKGGELEQIGKICAHLEILRGCRSLHPSDEDLSMAKAAAREERGEGRPSNTAMRALSRMRKTEDSRARRQL
jgi:hypothetical protein